MNQTQRRWTLRDRTAEAHAILDAAVGAFDDPESYQRYLLASYRFRIPLERKLDDVAWPTGFGDWRPRRLEFELRADLDDLKLLPPEVERGGEPPTQSGLLGMLYVLEGSALGAKLLRRRAEALGFTAAFGARHLAVHGEGDSWRSFLERLEGVTPFDIDLATSASLDTFAAAAAAFQGH